MTYSFQVIEFTSINRILITLEDIIILGTFVTAIFKLFLL